MTKDGKPAAPPAAAQGDGPIASQTPDDAEYIAHMAISLAQLARRHDLPMLGYLLEMAAMEATNAAAAPRRGPKAPGGGA